MGCPLFPVSLGYMYIFKEELVLKPVIMECVQWLGNKRLNSSVGFLPSWVSVIT